MNEKTPFSVEERIRKGVEKISKSLSSEAEITGTVKEDIVNTLKKELETKNLIIEEYTNTLKRLQAEFENYSKRVDKERREFAEYASENVVLKLLAVLDSFENALKNVDTSSTHGKGIRMLYDQLRKILEEEGLQHLEVLRKEFNVEEHEALLLKESNEKKNTIIEVVQTGYKLKKKVVRPAKVILSKGSEGEKEEMKRIIKEEKNNG